MSDAAENELTIEGLIKKALSAEVMDPDFADEMRGCADFEGALRMFYTHALLEGHDPETWLQEWGITSPE